MKKRVKKSSNSFYNLLVLLTVIIIASLVVDLLFLNVLYDLAKSNIGLEGELAISSLAQDCVDNNCDTPQDCGAKGVDARNSCISDECHYNPSVYSSNYEYYECVDECEIVGDYEKDWCMIQRDRCIDDCINKFPSPTRRSSPTPEIIIYWKYGYYETV